MSATTSYTTSGAKPQAIPSHMKEDTMHPPQKAQSPAATGLSANENTNQDIVSPKREMTLIARFAMKGAAVHRLADGGYIVCQWGLSRAVPDLPALAAFGRMMGVI